MNKAKTQNRIRARRVRRSRSKIFGSKEKPRLAVSRSNRSLSAQLIDDTEGKTLIAVSSRELSNEERGKKKSDQAALAGELIARKAAKLGITKAIFDRRAYRYHGRVKAFAEGARKAGLAI